MVVNMLLGVGVGGLVVIIVSFVRMLRWKKFKEGIALFIMGSFLVGGGLFVPLYNEYRWNKTIHEIKSDKDIIRMVGFKPIRGECYGDDCLLYFRYFDSRKEDEKIALLYLDSSRDFEKVFSLFYRCDCADYVESYDLYVKRSDGKLYLYCADRIIPQDISFLERIFDYPHRYYIVKST